MPGTDITGCGCDRSQQIGFAENLGKRPRVAACLPSPLVLWFRSLVVRWSISAFCFSWPVKSLAREVFPYFTGPWPVKSLAREVFPYFTGPWPVKSLAREVFPYFTGPWPVKSLAREVFPYFTGPWPVKSLAREVFPYFTGPWPVKSSLTSPGLLHRATSLGSISAFSLFAFALAAGAGLMTQFSMRLSPRYADFFRAEVTALRANAAVYRFDSRTDDTRRGGDVDILVLSAPPLTWEETGRL